MTALPQFDKVCNAANQSLASAFFWFGDEVIALLKSGEYRHISAAGMAVSDYLRTQGQSFGGHKVTTNLVYASHQAATKFGKAERTIFIKHNCPFHILLRLAGQPKEIVAEILADVQAGRTDWQGYKRSHKPPSVRRAKHWLKTYEKVNTELPRGEVVGCRGSVREASQVNPPVQADVEDPESVRSALLTMMTRRHQAILSDWNAAAERYNKGKAEAYKLPIMKTFEVHLATSASDEE